MSVHIATRPKLPCERLTCNDPECDRAHLCRECGKEECACSQDCLSEGE